MKPETEASPPGRRFVSGRSDEVDLRRLFEIVRTRALWILGAIVVIVGGLLAKAASEAPLYSSTAELLLQSRGTESANSGVIFQSHPLF